MRMAFLVLCIVFVEATYEPCFAQTKAKEDKRGKQLENEKRKLSTTNPANRAKALMRIAEITLSYVIDAANANDFPRMQSYVEQYRQAVTDARDAMMKSGLDPHKKSRGYQTVEIALRQQARTLQDIARLLSVDERQPVEEAMDMVSKIREEFVHALFG
jgi:hypothetical protein